MQAELDGENHPVEIAILGINEIGHEAGNPSMTEGRTIPWLQDVVDQNVWMSWNVTFRDVVVLNGDNVPIAVYNLTVHDLSNPANYAELKGILTAAAAAE